MSGFILVLNKPDNNSSDYITALLQLHTLCCGKRSAGHILLLLQVS